MIDEYNVNNWLRKEVGSSTGTYPRDTNMPYIRYHLPVILVTLRFYIIMRGSRKSEHTSHLNPTTATVPSDSHRIGRLTCINTSSRNENGMWNLTVYGASLIAAQQGRLSLSLSTIRLSRSKIDKHPIDTWFSRQSVLLHRLQSTDRGGDQ